MRKGENKMTDHDKIRIDRKQEMRTKAISKMISEGGLGADNYYNIIKDPSTEQETNEREFKKKDSNK